MKKGKTMTESYERTRLADGTLELNMQRKYTAKVPEYRVLLITKGPVMGVHELSSK